MDLLSLVIIVCVDPNFLFFGELLASNFEHLGHDWVLFVLLTTWIAFTVHYHNLVVLSFGCCCWSIVQVDGLKV